MRQPNLHLKARAASATQSEDSPSFGRGPWNQSEQPRHPMAVLTLVLWTLCLGVGLLGFALPYRQARPLPRKEEPMLPRSLEVELSQHSLVPSETSTRSEVASVPPALSAPTIPPPLLRPLKLDSLVEVQEAKVLEIAATSALAPPSGESSMAQSAPRSGVVSNPIPVQQLTLGQGEGKQPAPDYPAAAKRLRQEGSVVVRFDVNGQGQVTSADLQQPSAWPLLNQAALRVICERWRFLSGTSRRFEVVIRFEMVK